MFGRATITLGIGPHSSSFFFSSPKLSGRRLDVYHTLAPGVAIVRILNAGLKCAACGSLDIQDSKMTPKNRHLHTIAQLCWAVSSQLRNVSTIRKKLVKQQYVPHMPSQYGKCRPTKGRDRFRSLGFASWLCYCSDIAEWKSTKVCTMFGRLLGWGGRHLYSEGGHHVGHRPTF